MEPITLPKYLCFQRRIRTIECSYDKQEVISSIKGPNGKRKSPKPQIVRSFNELCLPKSVSKNLSAMGYKLFDMPVQLQFTMGAFKQFNNCLVAMSSKSDEYFKYLAICLQASLFVDVKISGIQLIIVCDSADSCAGVQQLMKQLLGYQYRSIDLKPTLTFKESQQILSLAPQIIIGTTKTINHAIMKHILHVNLLNTLFLMDIIPYSEYNSSSQQELKNLINSIPEETNKYFFYDPATSPIIPPSIYAMLEE